MDGIRGGIPHLSASKNALYELKMDDGVLDHSLYVPRSVGFVGQTEGRVSPLDIVVTVIGIICYQPLSQSS